MPLLKIKNLSADTINKIAAGEVIERPASVVKELVENALDAEAHKIIVIVEEGGKSLIKVVDDGWGIPKSEIPLLWVRHATSKLQKADDLLNVSSMGFRGEALSSIASVAEMTVESKYSDDETGFKISAGDVEPSQFDEISRSTGTTISVKNLFQKIPVRRKYLNNNKSESRQILKTINRLALGHPHISFELREGESELFSCGAGTSRERAGLVFGASIQEELIPVNSTLGKMKITGYIGSPEHFRGIRSHQYFYINGRYVQSFMLSRALATGYDLTVPGKYPVGFLKIEMPLSEVDINVHPAKKEVRFLNDKEIFSNTVTAVRQSLVKALTAPVINKLGPVELTPGDESNEIPPFQFEPGGSQGEPELNREQSQTTLLLKEPQREPEQGNILEWPGKSPETTESSEIKTSSEVAHSSVPMIQIHQSYLLFEVKSGMMVVNQQHAHERILYEQALNVLKIGGRVSSQQLLFPEIISLNNLEFDCVKNNLDKITTLGFDMQEFGVNTFQLRGIPTEISQKKALHVTREIINRLSESEGTDDSGPATLALAYASGSGLKLGEPLSSQEMTSLVDRLFATQNPYVSPRGKSVILRYRLDEFHRKFGVS